MVSMISWHVNYTFEIASKAQNSLANTHLPYEHVYLIKTHADEINRFLAEKSYSLLSSTKL